LGVSGPPQLPLIESFRNRGTPIFIAKSAIKTASKQKQFPQDVLLAEVVAHETGHKFGQHHPERENCCWYVQLAPDLLDSLDMGHFTADPEDPTILYVRYAVYDYPYGVLKYGSGKQKRRLERSDQVDSLTAGASTLFGAPATDSAVFSVKNSGPVPAEIDINNQLMHIMDWTPNLTLQDMSAWTFDYEDLNSLCVKADACGQKQP
jgi:hypothetical protein